MNISIPDIFGKLCIHSCIIYRNILSPFIDSFFSNPLFPRCYDFTVKLPDLLKLSALKFYFKYLHGSLPGFFYSFNIATQGTQHSHDTRHRDQLRVDRSRINIADNKIRIFLPTMVHSTPLDLLHKITTHSIQGFSSHIKRYLINRYRDNCSNTNCYVYQY